MVDFSLNLRAADYGTDSYGDLLLSDSQDLVLTSDASPAGTNAIGQDLRQRILCFAGECFVDTSLGVPYFQSLLGQKAPASTWDATLQAVVLQTPGVIQITEWKSIPDFRRRTLALSFRAETSSGPVTYNSTVDLNATA